MGEWKVMADEPNVVYWHGVPGTDYKNVKAVVIDGVRFERVYECHDTGSWNFFWECSECGCFYNWKTPIYCPQCGAKVVKNGKEER